LASPACFAYEQLPHADCAPRVPLYHPQLQLSFAAWPRLLGRYCASWQSRATSPRNKVETTPPSALPACMSTRILCEQPPVRKEPHRREAATAAQQSPVSSSRKPFSISKHHAAVSGIFFQKVFKLVQFSVEIFRENVWSTTMRISQPLQRSPCSVVSASRTRAVSSHVSAQPDHLQWQFQL